MVSYAKSHLLSISMALLMSSNPLSKSCFHWSWSKLQERENFKQTWHTDFSQNPHHGKQNHPKCIMYLISTAGIQWFSNFMTLKNTYVKVTFSKPLYCFNDSTNKANFSQEKHVVWYMLFYERRNFNTKLKVNRTKWKVRYTSSRYSISNEHWWNFPETYLQLCQDKI